MAARTGKPWVSATGAAQGDLPAVGGGSHLVSARCCAPIPGSMPRYSHARAGRRPSLGPTVFRSAWEANWARYLERLRQVGDVTSWEYEPEAFPLAGGRFYTPDFRVFHSGFREPTYHEVKGRLDAHARRVLRAMAERYPRVRLVLIDRATYERVEREVGRAIPGWEFRR